MGTLFGRGRGAEVYDDPAAFDEHRREQRRKLLSSEFCEDCGIVFGAEEHSYICDHCGRAMDHDCYQTHKCPALDAGARAKRLAGKRLTRAEAKRLAGKLKRLTRAEVSAMSVQEMQRVIEGKPMADPGIRYDLKDGGGIFNLWIAAAAKMKDRAQALASLAQNDMVGVTPQTMRAWREEYVAMVEEGEEEFESAFEQTMKWVGEHRRPGLARKVKRVKR
jgi:hypothetical protein